MIKGTAYHIASTTNPHESQTDWLLLEKSLQEATYQALQQLALYVKASSSAQRFGGV